MLNDHASIITDVDVESVKRNLLSGTDTVMNVIAAQNAFLRLEAVSVAKYVTYHGCSGTKMSVALRTSDSS